LHALELRQGAPGLLVAQTFQMESEVDAQGYFVLTKHVAVTLTIFDLIEVELSISWRPELCSGSTSTLMTMASPSASIRVTASTDG
jgi:hypothetical protein